MHTADGSKTGLLRLECERRNLSNQVRFIGTLSNSELADVYRLASSSSVPTLFEGGIPVANNGGHGGRGPSLNGGYADRSRSVAVIGNASWDADNFLFSPNSPAELAAKIRWSLVNRAKAIENYSALVAALAQLRLADVAGRTTTF